MQQRTPPLFSRSLVFIWLAQLASVIASGIFGIVQIFWLKEQTGSPAAMGIVGALSLLPSVAIRPVGGLVADRLPRRRIVAVCLTLSGLAVLALALAADALSGALGLMVSLVALSALIVELCNDFAGPALEATLPDLVSPERLAGANVVEELLMGVGAIASVILGSVLVSVVAATPLLLAVAATYAAAALLTIGARFPVRPAPTGATPATTPWRAWRADVAELRAYLRANAGLLWFGLLMAAEASVIGVIVLHAPFFMDEVLGLEAHWYGVLAATVSGGGVAGALLAGIWSPPPGRRAPLLGALVMGEGLYLALAAQLTSIPLLLALSVLGGAHGGYLLIQQRTLVEAAPPSALRGRVLGLLSGAHALLAAMGLAAGGFLGGLLGGVDQVYRVCGGAVALVGLTIMALGPVRAFLAAAPTDDEPPTAVGRAALDAMSELRHAVGAALLARGSHAPWGAALAAEPADTIGDGRLQSLPPLQLPALPGSALAGAQADESRLLLAAGMAYEALPALQRLADRLAREGDRPGAATALRDAAGLAEQLDQPVLAEQLYRRLLGMEPDDLDVRQQLVALALRQGHAEAAVAELWWVARLSREQHDDCGQFAALEQIVALARARHATQHEQARALAARGDHRGAARILRRLALLDPQPFAMKDEG